MCSSDLVNNLYISEIDTNRLRKITARNGILSGSCIISTYAGTGINSYSGIGGAPNTGSFPAVATVSIDMFDNVYFSLNGMGTVIKVTQYASIIRSSDFGQTWSIATPSISNVAFNNLSMSKTGQYVSATTLGGAIYRSAEIGRAHV